MTDKKSVDVVGPSGSSDIVDVDIGDGGRNDFTVTIDDRMMEEGDIEPSWHKATVLALAGSIGRNQIGPSSSRIGQGFFLAPFFNLGMIP